MLLSPYLHPMSSILYSKLCKSPYQCGVRIGLYTFSSRQGLCMGCHIMKGVSEQCIARLLLTIQQIFVCIENIIRCAYFSIVCIFETSYGLYVLWKELQQLQSYDQQHKQLKTDDLLVQTSPPHEEFITEVREELI